MTNMNYSRGSRLRITLGESVLVGTLDYIEELREEKFYYRPDDNFYVGEANFILDGGPSVEVQWDSRRGILADKVEVLD